MEEEILAEEEPKMFNPLSLVTDSISFVFQFLASYGWYMVGVAALGAYIAYRLKPTIDKWRQAREDADYHKDPDRVLARMEAIQRAREKQQQELLEASQRALEKQKEMEERKKAEALQRLEKYGSAGGSRLGTPADGDYMPLSGGASTSSYRAPKRSACSKGGCGR